MCCTNAHELISQLCGGGGQNSIIPILQVEKLRQKGRDLPKVTESVADEIQGLLSSLATDPCYFLTDFST